MKKILYLTYDGLSDPLGQSQILKYLIPLSKRNKIIIVSFEKNLKSELIKKIEKLLFENNIYWYKLKYHKKPKIISSLYDITYCILLLIFLIKKNNIKLVHSRSYLPTFIALTLKYIYKFKLIFDMRGFWADERVDGNIWKKNSLIYKITKKIENLLLSKSNHIVTLTDKSKFILTKQFKIQQNKITVIPTCVDLKQFNISKQNNKKNNKPFIVGYHGSIGTWYEFNKVLIFFKQFQKKINNSKLYIISKVNKKIILEYLNQYNINYADVYIKSCDHDQIHNYIKYFDLNVFFIKKCFSKTASCPTKFAESLSMGIPVVTGSEIGDVDKIFLKTNNQIGYIIRDFNTNEINNSINHILKLKEDIKNKQICFDIAKKYFDLNIALSQYENLYKSKTK